MPPHTCPTYYMASMESTSFCKMLQFTWNSLVDETTIQQQQHQQQKLQKTRGSGDFQYC